VLKRALDLALASLGLLLLTPLLVVIALAVVLDSPGPAMYLGRRTGRGGREFHLYKFRSMTAGADRTGPGITSAGDRRVTRVGHFLRRHKLDELPQLWNVVRGDMSLVGPRPEDPRYVALYTSEQRVVLSVRPGITGIASLRYRHEEELLQGPDWETVYLTNIMPAKLSLELAYLEHANLFTDMVLLLATVLPGYEPRILASILPPTV